MQKKVSFKSDCGYLLKGVLHLPRGKGPWPAVIVQHGFTSSHKDILIKNLAVVLAKQGIAALSFSFSGHGLSGGNYKNILTSQFLKDLAKGLEFLARQPNIRKHRLGLIGHSMGGFVCLSAASQLKEIRAVVSIASFYDVEKIMAKHKSRAEVGSDYFKIWGKKVTIDHFKDRQYVQGTHSLADIHCPALIIHGEEDRIVDLADAKEIYKQLNQPKDFKTVRNGSHSFRRNKSQRRQISGWCTGWCKKYLAFTESRVVNVFVQYKDEVLLLKRSQKVGTHQGLWCSVGGYIEDDETVLQAAKKEAGEELGLVRSQLNDYYQGKSFKFEEKDIDRVWEINPVLFRLKDKPKICLDWENDDYRWIKPSQTGRFKTVPQLDEALRRLKLI